MNEQLDTKEEGAGSNSSGEFKQDCQKTGSSELPEGITQLITQREHYKNSSEPGRKRRATGLRGPRPSWTFSVASGKPYSCLPKSACTMPPPQTSPPTRPETLCSSHVDGGSPRGRNQQDKQSRGQAASSRDTRHANVYPSWPFCSYFRLSLPTFRRLSSATPP